MSITPMATTRGLLAGGSNVLPTMPVPLTYVAPESCAVRKAMPWAVGPVVPPAFTPKHPWVAQKAALACVTEAGQATPGTAIAYGKPPHVSMLSRYTLPPLQLPSARGSWISRNQPEEMLVEPVPLPVITANC